MLLLQTKEAHVCISRSMSLPVINKEKDGSNRRVEFFFRVIPSTPLVKDADSSVPATSPAKVPGKQLPQIYLTFRIHRLWKMHFGKFRYAGYTSIGVLLNMQSSLSNACNFFFPQRIMSRMVKIYQKRRLSVEFA